MAAQRSAPIASSPGTNSARLLALIEENPGISRSDLARLSGLSRNTTSLVARALIRKGLIREVGEISSTGGRPGIGLAVDADSWVALGAALLSRSWVFVVVNLCGEVIHCVESPTDARSPSAAIRSLCDGIRSLRQHARRPLLPAVGIGVPGMIDPVSGTVMQADDVGWVSVPIKEEVERRVKWEAFVVNRHWGAGLAEGRWGGAAGAREYVYIGVGTGIRSAHFTKGELVEGAGSLAGQLGHMTVSADGPLCTCGNRGCLVSFASETALLERVKTALARGEPSALNDGADLTAERVATAARDGDRLALEALQRLAEYLGIAVANLVNVCNPERIVLGGPLGNTGEPLLSLVAAEAKRRALSAPFAGVRLVSGRLGNRAEAIGAATLVINRKLELVERVNVPNT